MIDQEKEYERNWCRIPNNIRNDLKILWKIVQEKEIDFYLYNIYVERIYKYDKELTMFNIPISELPK